MANQLETMDAPTSNSDNSAVSQALLSDANAGQNSAKTADIKAADQSQENKINATFGALTITGLDQGTAASDVKATSDTSPTSASSDVKATSDTSPTSASSDVKATSDTAPATADSAGDKGAPARHGDGTQDVAKQPDAQDVNADALKKIQDDPQVKTSKTALEADITKQEKGLDKGSEEYNRLEAMRHNMDTFEKRAASQNPPLGPEEVSNTYKSVSHMMDAKDGPNTLPKGDRTQVAEQLMMHAADPSTIDQGAHETCNVTTVETRMFAKNPSAAASLIDQVATTGEYKTPAKDGMPSETVKINADSLKRQGSEETRAMPNDGDRSYASQIFQVTAVNLSHQTHDLHVSNGEGKGFTTYPKGTVEYRQGAPDENTQPPTSGEVLWNKTTNSPVKDASGKDIHAPMMDDDHIVDTFNRISDKKSPDSGFYICNKDNVVGDGNQVTKIGSEAELKQKIEEAQKAGKMPILLGVNTGQEPFMNDTIGGKAGGAGGAHVVTITGIDKDGNVMMDNQWNKAAKHSVDMHTLYVATMTPKDAVTQLKADTAKNAAEGKVDYGTEAELLRLRHATGEVKDKEFTEEFVSLTQLAVKDANDNHGGHLDTRTEQELRETLNSPYLNQEPVLKQIANGVGADQLRGITDYNGNVGIDEMGQRTKAPAYENGRSEKAAQDVFDAGNQYVYFSQSDYDKLDNALSHKSAAEIRQMDIDFKAAHNGQSMEDYIKTRLSNHTDERDKALNLLHGAQNGTQAA